MLNDAGADWASLAYRDEAFGGANILGTFGILPVNILIAKMGFPALWNLNLTFLLIHISFVYLAVKAARVWAQEPPFEFDRHNMLLTSALVLLLGFSPMLAIRINVGHLNLILGMGFVQAVLTFWLCHRSSELSLTTFIVSIFLILHSLCSPSFQMLVYGLVFITPFFLCYFLSRPEQDNRLSGIYSLAFCLWVVLITCLIAAPVFLEMILYVLGPDAARTLGQQPVVYSYIQSDFRDWWSALFWYESFDAHREPHELHEIQYALGPFLISLVYTLYKRMWLPGLGFIISLVLCISFSNNLFPLSDVLRTLVPPLNDFRVAARSIIPLMLVWSCFVSAVFIRDCRNVEEIGIKEAMAAIVVTFLIFFLTPLYQEILIWTVLAGTLIALIRMSKFSIVGITVICIASLMSFDQKVKFDSRVSTNLVANLRLGEIARELNPDLANPLTRVTSDTADSGLLLPSVARIQTISGYGFPNRYFSHWVQSLSGLEYQSGTTFFNVLKEDPAYPVLQQLYNACCKLSLIDQKVHIKELRQTRGPIWSSSAQQYHTDFNEMAAVLKREISTVDWNRVQHLLKEHSTNTSSYELNESCLSQGFSDPFQTNKIMVFSLQQNSHQSCPVTVSMTYASNLEITVKTSSSFVSVPHYPAYGSLVGFVLPPDSSEILITSRPLTGQLSSALTILGLIGFFGTAFLIARLKR